MTSSRNQLLICTTVHVTVSVLIWSLSQFAVPLRAATANATFADNLLFIVLLSYASTWATLIGLFVAVARSRWRALVGLACLVLLTMAVGFVMRAPFAPPFLFLWIILMLPGALVTMMTWLSLSVGCRMSNLTFARYIETSEEEHTSPRFSIIQLLGFTAALAALLGIGRAIPTNVSAGSAMISMSCSITLTIICMIGLIWAPFWAALSSAPMPARIVTVVAAAVVFGCIVPCSFDLAASSWGLSLCGTAIHQTVTFSTLSCLRANYRVVHQGKTEGAPPSPFRLPPLQVNP